jgi:Tfp pilus assembly protein PilN
MNPVDDDPESTVEPVPPVSRPAAPAAPPLDRIEPLNLARRPFLNSRPVVRVSLLLWLLGLGLLLVNLALFQSYLTSSADKREQIARGEQENERQRQLAAQLQGRLDALDLEKLNEQVDFLNEKIEERTFSWSLMLDRIAEVLPNDVRLERLTPRTGGGAEQEFGRSRPAATSRSGLQDGRIPLSINGETRKDEALNRFVDNLFAHPAFADPNPLNEERLEDGTVRFELQVQYIPGGTPHGAVVGEVPTIEELPQPATTPLPGTAGPAAPPAPGGPP